jgi:hypothetical protein
MQCKLTGNAVHQLCHQAEHGNECNFSYDDIVILKYLMPRLLASVETGMLHPRLWWLTSLTRMDVARLIKRVRLASSGDKGQLNTAHSNAGCKIQIITMQAQPAGVPLLGCIAVVPWNQLRWKQDAQQVTKEKLVS